MIRFAGLMVFSLVTLAAASAAAQQTVPFRNNTPVAPNGIPPVPLPGRGPDPGPAGPISEPVPPSTRAMAAP